jgi:hypothetical protein
MSAVRPSDIRDERDVACPKARPDPDVMLVRSFSTTSRPSSAANNRGKLIDRHTFRAQHYAARRGRISVEGVK